MPSTYKAKVFLGDPDLARRLLLVVVGCSLAVSMVLYAALVHDRNLLEKYDPDWSYLGWAQIAVAALVAISLYAAARPSSARSPLPVAKETPLLLFTVLFAAGVLFASKILVIMAPESISGFVREGRPVSVLTEVAFVIAIGYLGHAWALARQSIAPRFVGMPPAVVPAILFALALLVLMEEMSWGQHWIGWQAGEFFAANEQNETNLHNFATHRFEAVYYTLAFLAFVALPAVWPSNPPKWLAPFGLYVPPRAFLLAGLPLAGFWFNDWNILPYKIMFFMGALFAAQIALECYRRGGSFCLICLAMLGLLVASQIVFLVFGVSMTDGHELSEIREFLIACLVAAYAVLIQRRIKHQALA